MLDKTDIQGLPLIQRDLFRETQHVVSILILERSVYGLPIDFDCGLISTCSRGLCEFKFFQRQLAVTQLNRVTLFARERTGSGARSGQGQPLSNKLYPFRVLLHQRGEGL